MRADIHNHDAELGMLVLDKPQYRAFELASRHPSSYQILLLDGEFAPDMHGTAIVALRDELERTLRSTGLLSDGYYVVSPSTEDRRPVAVCVEPGVDVPFGWLVRVEHPELWGEPYFVDPIPQYVNPFSPSFCAYGIWHHPDAARLSLVPRYREPAQPCVQVLWRGTMEMENPA